MCTPQSVSSVLQIIKDVVTIFSVAAAGVVAISGLHTWKRQLIGKADYETAKALLRSTYKVREAIVAARWALQPAGEIRSAMTEAGIESVDPTSNEYRYLSKSSVLHQRQKHIGEAYSEMAALLLEAEALWGSDVKKAFEPFNKVLVDYQMSVSTYLMLLADDHPQQFDKSREQLNRVVYDFTGGKANDAFSIQVAEAIQSIDDALRPRLALR